MKLQCFQFMYRPDLYVDRHRQVMILKSSQSIYDMVREHVSRNKVDGHMGKDMSGTVGNGGKGVQAVIQLGMFGLYEGTGSREHDVGVGRIAHSFVGVGGMASVGRDRAEHM